jgi:hypothetical protein
MVQIQAPAAVERIWLFQSEWGASQRLKADVLQIQTKPW